MPVLGFIFSLFTGPLGKIFTYGTIILAVVGSAWGYLKYQEHEAAVAALIKFNAAQLAQTQADNAANAAKLKQALSDEAAIQAALDAANKQIADNTGKTIEWITTQKDTGLDPIFNLTLQKMKGK